MEPNRPVPAVRFHHQEDNPGDQPQHITQGRGDVILHSRSHRGQSSGRGRRGPTLARGCRATFRTEPAFHWSATTLTERHETSDTILAGVILDSHAGSTIPPAVIDSRELHSERVTLLGRQNPDQDFRFGAQCLLGYHKPLIPGPVRRPGPWPRPASK